jgi:serine protease AprX
MNWAIFDTGIDATHSGFRQIDPTTKKIYCDAMLGKTTKNPNRTRVVETYDFTKFREMISTIFNTKTITAKTIISIIDELKGFTTKDENAALSPKEINDQIKVLEGALKNGRMLDWSVIGPFLRIPHNSEEYVPPKHSHGTHVAGILGANDINEQIEKNRRLIGMCPNINLYDIRVLDEKGKGDEFNILAALQFVRWLNGQSDSLVIQGINLSLSMIHEVDSFAAGRTPVCDACQRLVSEGTVVVAAAGNLGQSVFQNTNNNGSSDGYRTASITDPGNAECVITVGATHRSKPHTYGVSYFSSRGPTGDGRLKPDLVAPGEKIMSLAPNEDSARMDGSSMAAPHVSGAAALLLSKHKELIGNPQRVKEILCKTATDLGRERYFQGHGMVDVLRALQSV